MSTAFLPTESNPFAAPVIRTSDEDKKIPFGESYRVVQDRLYCHSSTDLSDVCWLSGQTEDLVSEVKIKRQLKPLSGRQLLMAIAIPLLTWPFIASSGFAAINLPGAITCLVLLMPLCLFVFGSLTPANFTLTVGVGRDARSAQRANTVVKLIILVFSIFMITITAVSAAHSTTLYPLLRMPLLWVLGVAVVNGFLRPKKFRPVIQRINDNLYAVTGLTPEFLHAANLRQNRKLHWPQ